jgi:hypothetical protein
MSDEKRGKQWRSNLQRNMNADLFSFSFSLLFTLSLFSHPSHSLHLPALLSPLHSLILPHPTPSLYPPHSLPTPLPAPLPSLTSPHSIPHSSPHSIPLIPPSLPSLPSLPSPHSPPLTPLALRVVILSSLLLFLITCSFLLLKFRPPNIHHNHFGSNRLDWHF